MPLYVVRRLLNLIPVLFLSSVFIWLLIYMVPGNPALAIVGDNATQAELAAAEARLGLDRPIYEQYFTWLGRIIQLDLGLSAINRIPVADQLAARIPATLQLTVITVVLAVLIAVPIGLVAALRPETMAGKLIVAYQAVTLAVPTFWVGMILVLVFSISLNWLPAISTYIPFFNDPVGALRNTFMPAVSMALYFSSVLSRFIAVAVSQTMTRDFVWFARSKGAPEAQVVAGHVIRNAALPTVTVLGLQIGALLGGSIVIEVVFSYPGVGRLLYSAILSRDYPVVQAAVLFAVLVFLIINLIVDLIYAVVDPRVRL